jgi:hypothetical protein
VQGPILDKPIYNVLFQNLLFLPSKKTHTSWGLKDLTSLPGLIFFEYDLIDANFHPIGFEVDCFKKLEYETNKFIPEIQRITFFMSKEPALRLYEFPLLLYAILYSRLPGPAAKGEMQEMGRGRRMR